ncbi:MAG: DUF3060 domain-containing protein [Saprospirales bacterium]|nr:DUF3060 domain-containing protein [Saprospirales bacterium]
MKKIILTSSIIAISIFSFAQSTSKTKTKTTTKTKPKTTVVKNTQLPFRLMRFILENNKEDATLTATDKAIVIDGNENKITITGNCKQIYIKGKNNDITIESLDNIEITGSGNFVSWEKSTNTNGKPTVKDKGGYNNVGKKSGQALDKSDN